MRRRKNTHITKTLGAASALILCIGGMGWIAVQSMGLKTADAQGCFAATAQRQTAIVVDASAPRWDVTQGRALRTAFERFYDSLTFNERLSIYTTEGDQIAAIVKPRFSVCGQVGTTQALEAVGAAPAQTDFLQRQKERFFDKHVMPELESLLTQTPDSQRLQNYESPIFEMIQAVTRAAKLTRGDRLIVISDFIQNSADSVQFCRVQNDMPRFGTFAKRQIYQDRLQPPSLVGVEVKALMLIRGGYGQGGLQFCHSEEELRGFWRDYFIANGVKAPTFVRVRGGYSEE